MCPGRATGEGSPPDPRPPPPSSGRSFTPPEVIIPGQDTIYVLVGVQQLSDDAWAEGLVLQRLFKRLARRASPIAMELDEEVVPARQVEAGVQHGLVGR